MMAMTRYFCQFPRNVSLFTSIKSISKVLVDPPLLQNALVIIAIPIQSKVFNDNVQPGEPEVRVPNAHLASVMDKEWVFIVKHDQ